MLCDSKTLNTYVPSMRFSMPASWGGLFGPGVVQSFSRAKRSALDLRPRFDRRDPPHSGILLSC